MASHYKISLSGIIQGVGFRPFVWSLAEKYNISGTVFNDSSGVVVDCCCTGGQLHAFVEALKTTAPPAAVIEDVVIESSPNAVSYSDFSISPSVKFQSSSGYISPDLVLCSQCQRELFDRENRRYLHPFINCTDCGPRYTIIKNTPYDRKVTTMASFEMCKRCEAEYQSPSDRRFHAEPISCPDCGPKCSIFSLSCDRQYEWSDCLSLLMDGKVGCLKGLGGYQLFCDVGGSQSVSRIRQFKDRPDKPFAIMARSLVDVQQLCHVSAAEEQLLLSIENPIVLLHLKQPELLSPNVCRGNRRVGVMLPTTAMHKLLFHHGKLPFMLMTSANRSGEPLIISKDQMSRDLSSVADFCIDHDRPISHRIDDSVMIVQDNQPRFIRRARGYAPKPIKLRQSVDNILALGGQQKNSFALGRRTEAFVSHHIGTLGYLETHQFLLESIATYKELFEIDFDFIVHDLHPTYATTQLAKTFEGELVAVQHHHAHHVSCMAEHQLVDQCIGIILDGSGYGDDDTIWGGEILVADMKEYQRVAHFESVAMVGGEQAVKQPFRMALSYLAAFLEPGDLPQRLSKRHDFELVYTMLQSLNNIKTSSCGRLFDAVAFLLGLIDAVTFEGQPAILVEHYAEQSTTDEVYQEVLGGEVSFIIPTISLVKEVYVDQLKGGGKADICRKFLNTLILLLLRVAEKIRQEQTLDTVVFSGGVFQNSILTTGCMKHFSQAGFKCYQHSKTPCNDGGLSLGQLCIGAARRCLKK